MVPRGGRYDLCTGPLSRLSGCRCGAVRQAASWPTALPLYQHRLPAAHFSLRVPEPRPPSCGETTDSGIQQVNEDLLQRLDAEQVQVIVHKVEAAEVDEMWSFVGSKRQQRW